MYFAADWMKYMNPENVVLCGIVSLILIFV